MISIVQQRRAKLATTLATFIVTVEVIAGDLLDDKIVLRLTDLDKIRLFKLQIWSWRYKVPVSFILNELLEFWQHRMPKNFKRQNGRLGLRIATLTNVKSHDLLLDRLKEMFPNHENEHEWRVAQKMAFVPSSSEKLFSVNDPRQFMKQYKARIMGTRRLLDATTKRFSSRNFRDNPFAE